MNDWWYFHKHRYFVVQFPMPVITYSSHSPEVYNFPLQPTRNTISPGCYIASSYRTESKGDGHAGEVAWWVLALEQVNRIRHSSCFFMFADFVSVHSGFDTFGSFGWCLNSDWFNFLIFMISFWTSKLCKTKTLEPPATELRIVTCHACICHVNIHTTSIVGESVQYRY